MKVLIGIVECVCNVIDEGEAASIAAGCLLCTSASRVCERKKMSHFFADEKKLSNQAQHSKTKHDMRMTLFLHVVYCMYILDAGYMSRINWVCALHATVYINDVKHPNTQTLSPTSG